MTGEIFDDVERTDASPSMHSEGAYSFLNRVAGPFWDRTRETMELWVSHLPADERADMVARLRSNDDGQAMAAYWELYLHESLLAQGFRLNLHVELPDTRGRPDFLAERADVSFLMEATRVGSSDAEAAAAHRREVVYDSLDRLDSPDFFLSIHVEEEGASSPPARRMREGLARWLDGLSYEEVERAFDVGGLGALPVYTWEGDGWNVSFRPLVKADARGRPGVRPLGLFQVGEADVVDSVGQVRRNLEEKAGRYGRPNLPLVIATTVDSAFFDDDYTTSGALFGRQAVQSDPETLEATEGRLPDGLWRGTRGPRNTSVSAVLVVGNLRPYHFTKREPVFWHNPWADTSLPDVLAWESVTGDLETGELRRRAARQPAHEILGVPEGWPGPEDPFPGA